MKPESSPIEEHGLLTLSDEVWEEARQRTGVIAPLAALPVVGHEAADAAAEQLGISRRQVYVLLRRYSQGAGLVSDLAPSRSSGGRVGW